MLDKDLTIEERAFLKDIAKQLKLSQSLQPIALVFATIATIITESEEHVEELMKEMDIHIEKTMEKLTGIMKKVALTAKSSSISRSSGGYEGTILS